MRLFKDYKSVAVYCFVLGAFLLLLFPPGAVILFIAGAVNYARHRSNKNK